MDEQSYLQEQLKDHEYRLRTLEKNYTEQKVNLINIEKGQSDLKLMITENNKQVFDMLNKIINADIQTKKTNQKNIWDLIYKIWVVVAPTLAVVISLGGK